MEILKRIFKEIWEDKVIIFQICGSVLLTALGYNSMQPQDLTTWEGVGNLIVGVFTNPYLLGLCVWNAWSAIRKPKVNDETSTEAEEVKDEYDEKR